MSVQLLTLYRDQFVAGFERGESILRPTVTTQIMTRGGQIYFLVVTSNGRSAVTRGSNGLIPTGDNSETQVAVTLQPDYDKQVLTGFDIFKAQSNQLEIMRLEGKNVLNRKIDATIIAALEGGSVSLGAVGAMTKTVANRIATILRNANAGEADRGNIYCAVTPACFAYMSDITSFGNVQYSNTGGQTQDGIPQINVWKYWMGINWGEHTGLTGGGTSAATCLAWHKAAVGHAIGPGTVDAEIGPVPGEDASYALHKVYHGAAKLQNSGIVKFTHDDSGLSS